MGLQFAADTKGTNGDREGRGAAGIRDGGLVLAGASVGGGERWAPQGSGGDVHTATRGPFLAFFPGGERSGRPHRGQALERETMALQQQVEQVRRTCAETWAKQLMSKSQNGGTLRASVRKSASGGTPEVALDREAHELAAALVLPLEKALHAQVNAAAQGDAVTQCAAVANTTWARSVSSPGWGATAGAKRRPNGWAAREQQRLSPHPAYPQSAWRAAQEETGRAMAWAIGARRGRQVSQQTFD